MVVMQQLKSAILCILYVLAVESVSVSLHGENVYSITYQSLQYFLFMADKEATITCKITSTPSVPNIVFKKEGNDLNTVLPESLYTLETDSDGQSHFLKLRIDSSGYTEITGDWTCEAAMDGNTVIKPFKTLFTNKPTLVFDPPLVDGVARYGTDITMECNCGSLDQFQDDLSWTWFMDNTTPASSKISYEGPGADDGWPSKKLINTNLDELDSVPYKCTCNVGIIAISSEETHMTVMRPPGTPKDLSLYKDSTSDTLFVKWVNEDEDDVITGYKVSHAVDTESPRYKEVSLRDGSVTHHAITGLESSTTYNVKVAAFNSAGVGMYSSVFTFKTSQPSKSPPVMIPPTTYDKNRNGHYVVDVGENVDISLPCQVKSNPKPYFQWFFNKKEINALDPSASFPGNYALNAQYNAEEFQFEMTLSIAESQALNEGYYTCEAINIRGRDSQTFFLKVNENEKQIDTDDGNSSAVRSTSLNLVLVLLVTVTVSVFRTMS